MKVEDIIETHKVSQDMARQIQIFNVLCEELVSVTEQENLQFLSEGLGRSKEDSLHKMRLMSRFQDGTSRLLEVVKKEEPLNITLHKHLAKTITTLQKKLSVNANLQIQMLEQNNRIEASGSGEGTWH